MRLDFFIAPKYRRGSRLALFAFLLAFVVIVLGAYTRLTDAGLSCPDWPHCYGYLTAPHTTSQLETAAQRFPETPVEIKKAWTEMTHRYVAAVLGILILILAGTFIFNAKKKDFKTFFIVALLVMLLGAQVILGMLTVTEKLRPVIVLSHLIVGISILSTLWWVYLDLHLYYDVHVKGPISPFLRIATFIAFGIVAAQIMLGGWVSTHYAGLACVDFPYCNGKLLPTIQWFDLHTDLISIHMLHRIGAAITGIYLAFFSFILLFNPAFRRTAVVLLFLIALQITLGIYNIIWLRPVWLAVIHQGVAIILLLTLITTLVKSSLMTRKNHDLWTA